MLAACEEANRDVRPLANTQEGTVPPAKSHVDDPSSDFQITVAPANILTKAVSRGRISKIRFLPLGGSNST